MKATHKIVVALVGASLLVTLVVSVSFWSFSRIENAAQMRRHARIVVIKSGELLSELKDAETSQRGYLFTGERAFLEHYLAVRDHIPGKMQELRQTTQIVAADERLNVLAPLVDAKLAEMAHVIELRRKQGYAAAQGAVRDGEGKRLMDAIRAEMGQFIDIEEEALARYEVGFQSDMRRMFVLIVVSSVFVLLFALALVYFVYRETQQRLQNAVYLETRRLLESQELMNEQLQQVNATLQASEEKLAVTLYSIGDAVMVTDASGRVTLLNPLAEQLTGWTQAQAIARPVEEVFHIVNQDTRLPAAIPVMETLAMGTIQGLANHTVLIARGGSECAIADSCAPIRDRDGAVTGAVLVFRDVTKEYAVQRELHEKNSELEIARAVADKANLAKSSFLSSMSHELRSPLNAILGFAQLLESDMPPPTVGQKEGISQILHAGWHLLTLINEILDLAKIESGQVPMSREPVSLGDVMLECRSMVEPQAGPRDIKLDFPRLDAPCFVMADRTRVKQVLINLLSNAIKYNREQGSVEVSCTASTSGLVRLGIRDTGAGLSPEQLAQLFQPFNRLGQEAGGEEGTGIGLVVAKRLVELMGGNMGVESAMGQGSLFWFELAATAEPDISPDEFAVAMRPEKQVDGTARMHTLLYVEDNPANLKLVERILGRRADIHLLTAINGNSGVEIARASLPEVILMDINLPDISGIQALKILHADPRTARIPIIAVSANAMPLDIQTGLRAGFFCYLTKPIKIDEFMTALDGALEYAENKTAGARSVAP